MKSSPEGMRPIGARLLKSAIDSLRPQLLGSHVLELFAGQGRFGFNCLEESAASVTFVEKNTQMVRELQKTAKHPLYKASEINVLEDDVFVFLNSSQKTYDLVFADPPFDLWDLDWAERFFSSVISQLNEDSILLVKTPSRMLALPQLKGITLQKETNVGESKLLYFAYGESKKKSERK